MVDITGFDIVFVHDAAFQRKIPRRQAARDMIYEPFFIPRSGVRRIFDEPFLIPRSGARRTFTVPFGTLLLYAKLFESQWEILEHLQNYRIWFIFSSFHRLFNIYLENHLDFTRLTQIYSYKHLTFTLLL